MKAAMKRNLIMAVLAFLGLVFFSRALHAQPVNVEAAKKEGKVVVYGLVLPQSMDTINKPFEKKYGVRVEYWRAAPNRVIKSRVGPSKGRTCQTASDCIAADSRDLAEVVPTAMIRPLRLLM